jgi:hypothetical protein
VAAPLLHAYVIVSVVVGIELPIAKLKTHLRVVHEIAILLTVMGDRKGGYMGLMVREVGSYSSAEVILPVRHPLFNRIPRQIGRRMFPLKHARMND